MMSIKHAIQWLYPYGILLGPEGKMAVEGVLKVSIWRDMYIHTLFFFFFWLFGFLPFLGPLLRHMDLPG